MKQAAFTLIELLAVLAILAIILLVTVPKVIDTIGNSKSSAFISNVKLIIKAIDEKRVEDQTFDATTLTTDNIHSILGLDSSNYDSLAVTIENGKVNITIIGKGAWNDLIISGTTGNLVITKASDFNGYADTSGANKPILASNMIPVYYDSTSSVWKKADSNNLKGIYSWYNYDSKIWANAVTVSATNRTTFLNAAVGTTIPEIDILTYLVWVPRYKYLIPVGTGARTISITFEKASVSKSTGDAITTYRTHPAFTFVSKELSGIWVGKFEVTGNTTTVTSKPGLVWFNHQSVSTYYTVIRNMELVGNAYGFVDSEVDTHMILNTEWGAIAYLTYSIYGKNSEVWVNSYMNDLTGASGTTVSSNITGTLYAYNNATYGGNSSTTGNVYGIYDMSGGAKEYVMGNYNSYSGYSTVNSDNSGFSGYNGNDATITVGLSFPESQYYNLYTTTDSTTACNSGNCYGQALVETSGWNADGFAFVTGPYPWLARGGAYDGTTGAGIFAVTKLTGEEASKYSTRIVISNQ